MIMNKKLRLLVTTKCPNRCPMCCNNSWDFDKLPVVERWDYDEIMITGGEPLLYSCQVINLVNAIKTITISMGLNTKVYLYTSICYIKVLSKIITESYIDGLVVTPHNERELHHLVHANTLLLAKKESNPSIFKSISLRLNLFPDMKALLPKDIDLSMWKVKDMEWIKDCPVPEGEDFRRIAKLW